MKPFLHCFHVSSAVDFWKMSVDPIPFQRHQGEAWYMCCLVPHSQLFWCLCCHTLGLVGNRNRTQSLPSGTSITPNYLVRKNCERFWMQAKLTTGCLIQNTLQFHRSSSKSHFTTLSIYEIQVVMQMILAHRSANCVQLRGSEWLPCRYSPILYLFVFISALSMVYICFLSSFELVVTSY